MLLETLFAASCGLTVYHHAVYPLILKVATRKVASKVSAQDVRNSVSPEVALIIPAFNEEHYIAAKIRNCATLRYPDGKLRIVIVCDGCTDRTAEFAREAINAIDAESR